MTESAPVLDSYRQLLRERLSEKRILHCLSVAEQVTDIGVPLGLDRTDLQTAGLLHDICRALEDGDMLAKAMAYHIPIDAIYAKRPLLLHGPVAAEWCRRELGIRNEAVCEAIHWHTTGHPGMGRLAQALYVADFCEPLRKYPEAAETRDRLRRYGFEAALRYAAESKLEFAQRKDVFHPETRSFRNWVNEGMPPVAVSA